MRGVEVVSEARVEERIHGERRAALVEQQLRVPAEGTHPPLAVERLHAAGGPTRGPILLVHGFAQNRFTWRLSERSLAGALAAEGYDVLNLELRGHGNSRAYGAGNARAFDEYVQDVVRVVERLDARPFAMGHSLGGGVLVGAATRTELAGLVHVAGVFAFGRRNRTIRALARLSVKLEPVLTLAPARAHTAWAGDLLGRAYGLTDLAGYGLPLAGWTPGSIERHLLEERLAKGFDWTSVEVWLQMARWARGEPFAYAEDFARLDLPLLVLAGDHDPLLPPADARACFEASGSSDKDFVVFEPFEHHQHWGHLDLLVGHRAPDVVWSRMIAWLNARSG